MTEDAPQPASTVTTAPTTKAQRPTNCTQCNKRLSRKSWYYRHGKYYCSKRCWKTAPEQAQKAKEGPGGTP